MPRKGYKSLTVKTELYEKLASLSKATNRTIPEEIEHLTALLEGLTHATS